MTRFFFSLGVAAAMLVAVRAQGESFSRQFKKGVGGGLQQGAHELKLGAGAARQGSVASLPLTLSSTSDVQGLVAAFEWDPAVGTGEDLVLGASLNGADTVVKRVEASYMVLGVVVDVDGTPPVAIPAGQDIELATVRIRCSTGGDADRTSAIEFEDTKYATVEGGPLLDNLITVGGLSIGNAEGLQLTNGSLTCRQVDSRVVFRIEDITAAAGSGCATASIRMDATVAIEGYELAIAHPGAALDLRSIAIGLAASMNGADFQQSEVLPGGGTLGVVLDLIAPFEGNVIPAGENLEIARFEYCCRTRPPAGGQPAVHQLTFVDGTLGSPPHENTAVSGGEAVSPDLDHGTFTCPPAGGEICDDDSDNDADGLVDCDDPDCAGSPACPGARVPMFACGAAELDTNGNPLPVEGEVGGSAQVCFYYKSPEDNAPGHQQFDQIQGLSMAVCYPCELTCREGTFDTRGTIVEAVDADFVSHQCDNDGGDGDGCELIIGILVDAMPPFDGKTLPPTEDFLRIGCIEFSIADQESLCGDCLPITFCDGADGRGKVPIKNLISAENASRAPALMNCELCVQAEPTFHRGDCNFSNMGSMSVDIADAAASISFLFGEGTWKFTPPCLDACDCNDDGRVDLADAMCILRFLFQFGDFPPAPGPGFDMQGRDVPRGEDPTEDKLGCEAGGEC